MKLLYILLILIIILGLLAIIYIIYYNKLQDAKLKIDEAELIIDENLRKKYDNLIEIKNIIKRKLKNNKINFKDLDDLKLDELSNFDIDRKLDQIYNLITTIINDYQETKDNIDINDYLNDIDRINEKLDSAKSFYNKYITESNALVLKFPSNIVALVHKIKVKNFFDNKDLFDENLNDFKL